MRSSDPISIPLPFEDWPAADRQAWEVAITPASLFGNGGTAAHWAAVTLRGYRAAYGRWLRFLISQDWLDVQAPFASRARPDRVAAYVKSLEGRVSPLRSGAISATCTTSTTAWLQTMIGPGCVTSSTGCI